MKLFKALMADIAVRRHPDKAESWVKLGMAYVRQGRRASNPDFTGFVRPGGDLHPKNFAAAISAYQHAISLKPDCAEAWAHLGRAYMLRFRRGYFLGDARLEEQISGENRQGLEIAVGALENAVQMAPNNSILWNDLGFAYSQLDRFDDEVNAYRQALKVEPCCKTARHNLTTFYHNRKEHDKLAQVLKEAEEACPQARLKPTVLPRLGALVRRGIAAVTR